MFFFRGYTLSRKRQKQTEIERGKREVKTEVKTEVKQRGKTEVKQR